MVTGLPARDFKSCSPPTTSTLRAGTNPREDLFRVFSSEIKESITLLRKAYLFNKTAHAGVFADVIFRLLRQNRCCAAASYCYQEDGE
jgi:hypothetical protein